MVLGDIYVARYLQYFCSRRFFEGLTPAIAPNGEQVIVGKWGLGKPIIQPASRKINRFCNYHQATNGLAVSRTSCDHAETAFDPSETVSLYRTDLIALVNGYTRLLPYISTCLR